MLSLLNDFDSCGRFFFNWVSKSRHKDFRTSYLVCSSRSDYPPGFWNGLDWRALVKLRPPIIGKLREKPFLYFFIEFFFFLNDILRFFQIGHCPTAYFLDMFTSPQHFKTMADRALEIWEQWESVPSQFVIFAATFG